METFMGLLVVMITILSNGTHPHKGFSQYLLLR